MRTVVIGTDAVCNVSSGRSKSNLGWTPLHLACYFGHRDVVEELLKVGFILVSVPPQPRFSVTAW